MFFRINIESFQRRHGSATIARGGGVTDGPTTEQPSSGQRGSVFMRSRPIQLVNTMHLFQVQEYQAGPGTSSSSNSNSNSNSNSSGGSRVYTKLTLYGMEGHRFESHVPIAPPVPLCLSESQPKQIPSIPVKFADSFVLSAPSIPSSSFSAATAAAVSHAAANIVTVPAVATNTIPAPVASNNTTPAAAAASSECIICLTNPQTTLMFPCRHMCLCKECAGMVARGAGVPNPVGATQEGSHQEKRCPVCRKPVIIMLQLVT
jgi:hypothetical protein